MARDPWQGMLDGEPLLGGLAKLAALRRHARARAEEEDLGDLPDEEEAVRLAAADVTRRWTSGSYVLEARDGGLVQVGGPAGLTILVAGRRVPLVPGVAVPVGAVGDVIDGLDARGRKIRLERA